ncbi:MAG: acyl-ACP--UDP-N-acetylglucosamine O-acyltransferase [Ignavibacteria bacterium]|nr:acyl-ACP--UDP-N-acetylglucosamine O-acyltransferase [Ignavibacteria bacterium]
MSVEIHPSSVISKNARISDGVSVGPFCVIESDVEIGQGTVLMSNVFISNGSRIGTDVRIHPGVVVGTQPQDLKYAGQGTLVFVGDRTVLREYTTVNRGTVATGRTVVGSDCLLMAYSHVAHDCVVGNNVILANSVNLGGHVEVHDWGIVGGVSGIHQFTRIGAHSMIAGCSRIVQDVPPYTLAAREPLIIEGLNLIGLRRRGFTPQTIKSIEEFYDILYTSQLNTTDALEYYESAVTNPIAEVQVIIDFIRSSKRGFCRKYVARSTSD